MDNAIPLIMLLGVVIAAVQLGLNIGRRRD